MADVPVGIHFTATDRASSVMDGLIRKAEGFEASFNHLSNVTAGVLGVAGGLGAAFGFEHLIEGAGEHIEAVAKMRALTHETAEAADGILEAFELAGLSVEEATTAMGRLSLQTLKVEDAMMGMGGGVAMIQKTFQHLGVDLQRGTVPAMMQMAKLAQQGKLHAMDLRLAMRMPMETAIKFQRMLARGPLELQATMHELQESGTAVTAENITAFYEMRRASAEMHAAWKRMTLVVGRELLPVITALLRGVAERVKGWIIPVRDFGRFLAMHLHTAIGLALTLGKILLANAALQRMGVGGIGGVMRGAAGIVGRVGTGAAEAVAGYGLAPLGGVAAAAAGTAAFMALVAAVLVVVEGFNTLATNYRGWRDLIEDSVDKMVAAFDSLLAIFGTSSADLGEFFKVALPATLNALIHGLTDFANFLEQVMQVLGEALAHPVETLTSRGKNLAEELAIVVEMQKEAARLAKADRDAAREAAARHGAEGKADVNQIFNNARFDITQKFEEGFDPDRILTTFTNDLAALGERGITSGFQPAYVGSVSKG